MTTAAASPFGDDWWKVIKQMQDSLRTPAWQAAMKQMQAVQVARWQDAAKKFDLAETVRLPEGLDISAMSRSILDSQSAEVQAAIKRLGSESGVVRWTDIAKQISTPALPPQFAPEVQAVLANLQREFAVADRTGFSRFLFDPSSRRNDRYEDAAGACWNYGGSDGRGWGAKRADRADR